MKEILSVLSRNKLRTFLTAFGVFWGIFMLVVMLGTGKGLENGVMQRFSGRATNSFFLWAQQTSKPYAGFASGRSFNLTNDDLPYLKENLEGVSILAPRVQLGGHRGSGLVTRKDKSSSFEVSGDYPQVMDILPVHIKEGRFINQLDIEDFRKNAVIGERVAELLFDPGEEVLGQVIKVSGVFFQVVGVLTTKESGDRASSYLESVHIPFTTFQRAFNKPNEIDWFMVTGKDDVDVTVMEEEAVALLSRKHKVHPEDPFAFGHYSFAKMFNKLNMVFTGVRALVWIVGVGTLLAGIVGVSNILLITVKERTREFGIRRAIGAKPRSIMLQVISESLFLTGASGYLGLLTGIGLIEILAVQLDGTSSESSFAMTNPEVNIGVAVSAMIILMLAGLAAGIIPAKRAVEIRPVEALRSE